MDAITVLGPPPARADGRFAPSPTAPLHLGNLRTALLAWLFARAGGGRFLVRIEDLDTGRARPTVADGQLADLAALGLDWDADPVRQSDRGERYAAGLARLQEAGHVYRCWCTRAEIRAAASAPHGEPAGGTYPGTCRELPAGAIARHEAAGRRPALRIRAAGARETFTDRLHGETSGVVDDLVVRRNDGAWAYNLAVVIDDDAQDVGEVVRGDDLLAGTPRQLHLQQLLGLQRPGYAHVPLLLGPDGVRLAKRHGAVTLAERLALGERPEQVRGALAAGVGLAVPGESPSLDELLARTSSLLTAQAAA